MADIKLPQGFGDPETVRRVAEAFKEAMSKLDGLTKDVNRDVSRVIPDLWGGESATDAQRQLWETDQLRTRELEDKVLIWTPAMEHAAATMQQAKGRLEYAQKFADKHNLVIGPDLTVTSIQPHQRGAEELVRLGQGHVNTAKDLADRANATIRVANGMLENSLNNAQQDLRTLLESVFGGGGKSGKGGGRGSRLRITKYIKPKGTPAQLGQATPNKKGEYDYVDTFKKGHPEIKDEDIVVHHGVEQDVLKKYPGVITESELHSLENLRGFRAGYENYYFHLSKIREEWNIFYRNHPDTVTKPELQNFATYIDDKYGMFYYPPIRPMPPVFDPNIIPTVPK